MLLLYYVEGCSRTQCLGTAQQYMTVHRFMYFWLYCTTPSLATATLYQERPPFHVRCCMQEVWMMVNDGERLLKCNQTCVGWCPCDWCLLCYFKQPCCCWHTSSLVFLLHQQSIHAVAGCQASLLLLASLLLQASLLSLASLLFAGIPALVSISAVSGVPFYGVPAVAGDPCCCWRSCCLRRPFCYWRHFLLASLLASVTSVNGVSSVTGMASLPLLASCCYHFDLQDAN